MASITISELKSALNVWKKQNSSISSISKAEALNLYARLSLYKYIGGKEDPEKLLYKLLSENINLSQSVKLEILVDFKKYLVIGVLYLIKINSINKSEFIKQLEKQLNISLVDNSRENYESFTTNNINNLLSTMGYSNYNPDYLNIVREYSDTFI